MRESRLENKKNKKNKRKKLSGEPAKLENVFFVLVVQYT